MRLLLFLFPEPVCGLVFPVQRLFSVKTLPPRAEKAALIWQITAAYKIRVFSAEYQYSEKSCSR